MTPATPPVQGSSLRCGTTGSASRPRPRSRRGSSSAASRRSRASASARVLLCHQLMPSLRDARETVEAGIELQGILERVWRDGDAATAYGLGLALRLRGGTDFSNVLAESRLFIRVLATPAHTPAAIARTNTMPETTREMAIVVGLGAMFGGGEPDYARRFRPRPLAID